ncbi:diguanylate cyclase domain-containing protein [Deinococcus peraridilitoris]|uniref:Diguanylate cyclase (GGDEF) domain-containing protein n=1 Tax=Deinococcus peraridilitoris (strain DSM 19664 / LMG 22246 / CIP 109416 / KR-200) TaxID=937777 RepID=K9ZXV5_DEIPD|nr:diguanylate cyclase [Deinococcus peraridilitoris]AFZ66431.1 diguanylate cyclase (GGDEF) domain-containing protein [Deinococcus peraridilitoris DSM 19664]
MTPDQPQKSVAIIIDYLYTYQLTLLSGIRKALDEAGLPSMVYSGRELDTALPEFRKANDLYALISPELHRGVIVLSSNFGYRVSDEVFLSFLKRFVPLPIVSVGRSLPGIPSVLVNGKAGMQQMMDHLLHSRRFRRFALVRGIPGNADSDQREQVFRDALHAQGLTADPELLLTGRFVSAHAHQEILRLARHRRDFDVVVSVNDEMTDGIVQGLRDAGLRVPEDVAVVGFDDSDPFRHALPPLTTVRQPLHEQGAMAAQLLLDLERGANPHDVLIDPQLIVRESCGMPQDATSVAQSQVPLSAEEEQLAQAFQKVVLSPEQRTGFLLNWREGLLRTLSEDEDFRRWRSALQRISATVQRALPADSHGALQALTVSAYELLYDALQTSYVRRRICELAHTAMTAQMYLASDERRFREEVGRYLSHLNVGRCILVLYDSYGPDIAPRARVVLAEQTQVPVDEQLFPTSRLLPDSMIGELGRGHLLMSPLFVKEVHYGYLLYDQPSKAYFDEETPRHTVSRAIWQLEQVRALREHSDHLEQQVRARTRQLEDQILERTKAEHALREAHEELQRTAVLDGLTQLYNRAAFDQYLQHIWEECRILQRPVSVLLCDVDYFKRYNDHYGHLQGDQCLREVAAALSRSVRDRSDFAARYGGEEFVVLLPGTDAPGARRVAERVNDELALCAIAHARSDVSAFVTISVGVATLTPDGENTAQDVLAQADALLYQAKQSGRRQIMTTTEK